MLMHLDRGDRRTLQVAVTRAGTDPADAVQFRVGSGSWLTISPVDADANPAMYELLLAYGDETDFPTAHPSDTITVTTTTKVLMRPPSGRDIDVQQVAWITVRA